MAWFFLGGGLSIAQLVRGGASEARRQRSKAEASSPLTKPEGLPRIPAQGHHVPEFPGDKGTLHPSPCHSGLHVSIVGDQKQTALVKETSTPGSFIGLVKKCVQVFLNIMQNTRINFLASPILTPSHPHNSLQAPPLPVHLRLPPPPSPHSSQLQSPWSLPHGKHTRVSGPLHMLVLLPGTLLLIFYTLYTLTSFRSLIKFCKEIFPDHSQLCSPTT